MEQFEKKIAIRQITKADDRDYKTALEIYNKMASLSIKAEPNSITFWLGNENNKFKSLVFALYLNNEIIGFAMMTYIKRIPIITLDYIELRKEYWADNAIFSTYINLLQNFLRENGYDWKYIVNETSNKDKGKNIDRENRFFKKISFLEGFGKIEAKYCTPPIGNHSFAGSSEAFLYIKSKNGEEKIFKEDYLKIVESIYYDYYYVWYEGFLLSNELPNEFEHYKKDLNKSFNSINLSRLSTKSFKVNYSPDALFISKHKIKDIVILFGIIFLVCPLLMWLCQYIPDSLKNHINSINSIVGVLGSLITYSSTILTTKKRDW